MLEDLVVGSLTLKVKPFSDRSFVELDVKKALAERKSNLLKIVVNREAKTLGNKKVYLAPES